MNGYGDCLVIVVRNIFVIPCSIKEEEEDDDDLLRGLICLSGIVDNCLLWKLWNGSVD